MPKEGNFGWLRMKQLPKDEYAVVKVLIETFDMVNVQEVFGVLLRVVPLLTSYDDEQGVCLSTLLIRTAMEQRRAERPVAVFENQERHDKASGEG